ncbi:MAG: glycoside hydrolase family 2 TIM barrel-domain containing protein [Bacteroidales bacterium]
MKALVLFLSISVFFIKINAQDTQIIYLTGTGNDKTAQWDFFCTEGRNSGKWTKIDVPSCWELKGFGTYNYGHDSVKANEHGLYRYRFMADKSWKDKKVELVFEGVMTDVEVKINGKLAGAKHQGGFYCFKYDISGLIKPGKLNLLEADVAKMSSNPSVNEAEREADYWIFGGIYRPVYLQIKPENSIDRVAIDGKSNGSFNAEIYFNPLNKNNNYEIELNIVDLQDNTIQKSAKIREDNPQSTFMLNTKFAKIRTWHPEHPFLYLAIFKLFSNGKEIHTHAEKFGFRTVEFKNRDGIYVNGNKIMFKGVNRHSFYPASGRTTSKEISIADVKLIKQMNMNAVRMSHYPPDGHFLDACDSLGLFVIDELAGWQWPPYDTEIGKKLVREMVYHDINHASVVMWSNGNEGGFNFDLDTVFKTLDIQKRKVIHPWSIFEGTDTQHYKSYNYGTNTLYNGREVFFPTEFLHGLYDGGHGAGLNDHWNLMLGNPLSAGGFLWCLIDEGVVRTDKKDSIDCDGNHAPDGILGPYREKEGSFNSIKEIWSPVFICLKDLPPAFSGILLVQNRYLETNLKSCLFTYNFKSFQTGKVLNKQAESPDLEPGENGFLHLTLPEDWRAYDVLYLTAFDATGNEIYTWSWPLKSPKEVTQEHLNPDNNNKIISFIENETSIDVLLPDIKFSFDAVNGMLLKVIKRNQETGLSNGPVFVNRPIEITNISHSITDQFFTLTVSGKNSYNFKWTIYSNGLARLEYRYVPDPKGSFYGISFDYPENEIKSVNYLGNGPYRVYKNRMKGVTFNKWEKKYNNTITGVNWEYPEFKGYYSRFYYAEILGFKNNFKVYTETEDLFLRLFTPEVPSKHGFAAAEYPTGNISFLHAISPIGTKFDKAENHGPEGQPNEFQYYNTTINQPLTGVLWFDFKN